MINVLFFVQYKSMGSSSRGILSGGTILDFGDMCDEQYMNKICKGSYKLMYQVGRTGLKDLKSMSLEEFEAIFFPKGWLGNIDGIKHLLGYNGYEPVFRKEILNKYGPNANAPKPKTTTSYEAGAIITGTDKVDYVYIGNMKLIMITVDGSPGHATNGHMYIPRHWLEKKYGSLMVASATSSLEIVLEYLAAYINRYSKIERNMVKNKRKAIKVHQPKGIDPSWLMRNNGHNIVGTDLKPNMLYSYERRVRVELDYSLK